METLENVFSESYDLKQISSGRSHTGFPNPEVKETFDFDKYYKRHSFLIDRFIENYFHVRHKCVSSRPLFVFYFKKDKRINTFTTHLENINIPHDCKFIYFPVALKYENETVERRNMFLWNKKNKTLEHFEPLGEKYRDFTNDDYKILKSLLLEMLGIEVERVIPVYFSCPIVDKRNIQAYCTFWSWLFLETKLLSPEKTSYQVQEDIQKYIKKTGKTLPEYIRTYAYFLYSLFRKTVVFLYQNFHYYRGLPLDFVMMKERKIVHCLILKECFISDSWKAMIKRISDPLAEFKARGYNPDEVVVKSRYGENIGCCEEIKKLNFVWTTYTIVYKNYKTEVHIPGILRGTKKFAVLELLNMMHPKYSPVLKKNID